jgi:hypothetical protein
VPWFVLLRSYARSESHPSVHNPSFQFAFFDSSHEGDQGFTRFVVNRRLRSEIFLFTFLGSLLGFLPPELVLFPPYFCCRAPDSVFVLRQFLSVVNFAQSGLPARGFLVCTT